MTILMFPGQGSQFKGMGRALLDKFPDLTARASDILGYDVRELCLEDPEKKLGLTQYTQPAIFLLNALGWYDIREQMDGGSSPRFSLGHSLGEYNALLAADVFDFQDGLKLVQERGRLMGEIQGGGMAAVMSISPKKIREVLAEQQLADVDLANFNTPSQTVIAGPSGVMERAAKALMAAGARFIPLKVSAPFHSRYMTKTSVAFGHFLKDFTFRSPSFPVISNATARPYGSDEVSDLLVRQIAGPVKWEESIRYLMAVDPDSEFREVNANILTRMVSDIQKNCTPLLIRDIKSHEPIFEGQGPDGLEAVPVAGRIVGNPGFCKRYGLRHPYVAGAMYRGIGSKEMAVAMARAGMISYLGIGGLPLKRVEKDIQWLGKRLGKDLPWGANLLYNSEMPQLEEGTVDLYLKYGVRYVEASAYTRISPALVRYRLRGLKRDDQGRVVCTHHVLGKCSRPEMAEHFLSPAPDRVVQRLLDRGEITGEQAEMARKVPVASEICVEADSAGHTDMGIPTVLLPAMKILKDRMTALYKYREPVYLGLGGGIGTPESAMVAFFMGADFILTGSINQCTVESGCSGVVKGMLQDINIQDTDYAPAGDGFEIGSKVQVLRRGVFFPARAKKLFQIYSQFDSLEDIPKETARQIQDRYFRRRFEDIWHERKAQLESQGREGLISKIEANPKQKMAAVFRWYFRWSADLALAGDLDHTVDFQVHTGPALGAFNQWVQGTDLESWQNRHVDLIALKLLDETEAMLKMKMKTFSG